MKKILTALLAVCLVLSLAACNGGGGTSSPASVPETSTPTNEPAPSGDKIAINVIAAEYGQNTKDWWAKFQDEFNKANAGIDLTVEVVSWNDIYTVVNTRISGNAAPDILNIDVFADYQADGLLLPAKDYVSEATYNKMYPLGRHCLGDSRPGLCPRYVLQCGHPEGRWRGSSQDLGRAEGRLRED